jgi:hypothetical protein
MSRRGSNRGRSQAGDADATKPRVSVFDRLGPLPSTDDKPTTKPVLPTNENRAPYQARSRGAKPSGATATPGVTPRTLQPNALLHRSLQEVRKARTSEAMTAPGAVNAALQARVAELESKLAAAEELGDALMFQQQALLTEKARMQAENAQLTRETAALRERLDFLHFTLTGGEGAVSPAPVAEVSADPGTVVRPQAQQGPPPTPDSAMLRVLRTAELGMDGEADPAHLVSYAAGSSADAN